MKTLLWMLLLILGFQLNAQNYRIVQDSTTGLFDLKTNAGKSLKKGFLYLDYAGAGYFQALTQEGKILYFNQDLKKVKLEDTRRFSGFCGTVSHYDLTIKKDQDSFYVMKDETFFDHNNEIAPECILRVSRKEVDQLFFINGMQTFSYNDNYGLAAMHYLNPQIIIFKKDGKYGILGKHSDAIYDKIERKGDLLLMEKDGLVGYWEVQKEPIYTKIGNYIYHLAKFEAPDGRKGFVDLEGKEYMIP